MAKNDDAGAAFHAHLDQCAQCRDHPFKLCHAGGALLRNAGEAARDELAQREASETPAPLPVDEEGFPF